MHIDPGKDLTKSRCKVSAVATSFSAVTIPLLLVAIYTNSL